MNKGCLNVIWHFPLFGFITALIYGLGGVIWCCTIVFYPIGLGYFQVSKYLFSPFTTALVSKDDLRLISDNVEESLGYSKIIGFLFIPFGILSALGAIFHIVYCCASLIGIPCAYVWFKTLPSLFNPTNKICVPIEVANEIERVKSGDKLASYTGNSSYKQTIPTTSTIAASASTSTPIAVSSGNPLLDEVRGYSDERLNEISQNAVMYNSSLVELCSKEIAIRQASAEFMAKVEEFSDEKLKDILANTTLYSEEIIYCCRKEYNNRLQVLQEKKRQEELIQQEKREAEWKKQQPYVIGAVIVAIILISFLIYNNHQQEQKRIAQEKARIEAQREAEEQEARERILAQERKKAQEEAAKQKAAENARIAAEKKKEAERIAAEKARIEKERILKDAPYRREVGAYLVGEIHADRGIVIWVDDTYKHGITCLKKERGGSRNEIIEWCESLGNGWRVIGPYEANIIYKNKALCKEFKFLESYIWHYKSAESYYYTHIYYEGRDRFGSSDPSGRASGYAVKEF